jgi:DNA-binding MarR family transcriptional regulator
MRGDDVLDDARLTTVGLLFESAAGLRRMFELRLTKENELSSQAFDVLIRLARTPQHRLRMSELAAQTSLTPSGLTRSVDRLEQSGLVARESCPDDRRGAFAVLTATGQEVMDRAIPGHIAHVDEVLQSLLTPEEEATLSSLLRKIRDQLYDPEGACEAALGELDPLDCPSAG